MTVTEMIEDNLEETRKAYALRASKVASILYAERKLTEAQRSLEAAKNEILVGSDPKELGANEAIRSAKIAELTTFQQTEVSMQQDCVRALQTELEIARLECRRCDLALQHLALLK